MVVFWQSYGIQAKAVVIGQKWILSGKSCSIRSKEVIFLEKWLYSGKRGCIPAKCCIRAKVVIFGL